MNIKQVLDMPVGQKFGGFDVTIKTCKKRWQVKEKWVQQIVITDTSGDAIADVNVIRNSPLQRGSALHITVGIVQAGETGKKLYIDQFVFPDIVSEPTQIGYDFDVDAFDRQIDGKIRHGLVCSYIRSGNFVDKDEIRKLVKFIKTGN